MRGSPAAGTTSLMGPMPTGEAGLGERAAHWRHGIPTILAANERCKDMLILDVPRTEIAIMRDIGSAMLTSGSRSVVEMLAQLSV